LYGVLQGVEGGEVIVELERGERLAIEHATIESARLVSESPAKARRESPARAKKSGPGSSARRQQRTSR
jgi:hypothetical protein